MAVRTRSRAERGMTLYGHSVSGVGAAVDHLYGNFGTNGNEVGAGNDSLFGQGGNVFSERSVPGNFAESLDRSTRGAGLAICVGAAATFHYTARGVLARA